MLNIKILDPHKAIFRHLVNLLPLGTMEEQIKHSDNYLVQQLYKKLNQVLNEMEPQYQRSKLEFYKLGIASIYTIMDPIYGEPIEYMLGTIDPSKIQYKAPREWRINQEVY